MAATAPVNQHPQRGRGRTATHDAETLFDLVAAVARAAVTAGRARVPERVAMAAFNVVKLDVDLARGIADPKTSPERTPTADAIQMRFKELAGRPVGWAELVEVALRPPDKRPMWLGVLRRDDARDDLTDALVAHALQRVAHERKAATVARNEYAETQQELVAADRDLYGDDGLLEELLPTDNQILVYCDRSWPNALKLAGLKHYSQPRSVRNPQPSKNLLPSMPYAEMVAFYAALNGHWPSDFVLLHFAAACNIRMEAKLTADVQATRNEAARLLTAAGVASPLGTRPRDGARLPTYRFPVNGIPGAPLRGSDPARARPGENPRLDALRQELAVSSLRVWLAGLAAGDKRVRAAYVRWQVGSDWTTASSFDRHRLGSFSELKREANDENARLRQAGGDPLADALAGAAVIRADIQALRNAGSAQQPDPVPFADALRTVLAGPHGEVQPPKQ
jgi:hypothetical protein